MQGTIPSNTAFTAVIELTVHISTIIEGSIQNKSMGKDKTDNSVTTHCAPKIDRAVYKHRNIPIEPN